LVKQIIPNGKHLIEVSKNFNFKSLNAVRYHIGFHEKVIAEFQNGGVIPSSNQQGRPSVITESQLKLIQDYIENSYASRELLTFSMIQRFITEKMTISAPFESIRRILNERGIMQMIPAQPVEPGRFNISGKEIFDYFEKLKSEISGTPSNLVYNVDESGFQEWVDTKHLFACVPSSCKEKKITFPVPRNGKRATMLVGVSLSGDVVKPCLVFSRVTFDTEIFPLGYQNKAMFASQPSGYVNKEIFLEWHRQCFIPHVRVVRDEMNLACSAKLIMDGCRAHVTPEVSSLCSQNGIDPFLLPPHSSHLLQPLDNGIFSVQKTAYKNFQQGRSIPSTLTYQSRHVIRLIASLRRATDPIIIVHSFRSTGIVSQINRGPANITCVAAVAPYRAVEAMKIILRDIGKLARR